MKHNYINPIILRDYTVPEYLDDVIDDLKALKLKNIHETEDVYEDLAWLLHDDIVHHFANYKAYVEPGMDLRILSELRKSALLATNDEDFMRGHGAFDTVEEIKQWRIQYMSQIFEDYRDADWQLYWIIHACTEKEHQYFIDVDFDNHFWMLDTPQNYKPQNYMIEAMRGITHYDCTGKLKAQPIDIVSILQNNVGWDGWLDINGNEIGTT